MSVNRCSISSCDDGDAADVPAMSDAASPEHSAATINMSHCQKTSSTMKADAITVQTNGAVVINAAAPAASWSTLASESGVAATATSSYIQQTGTTVFSIFPSSRACRTASQVAGEGPVATDGEASTAVINISNSTLTPPCRTASYCLTGTQYLPSKPTTMQDSLAQRILRAQRQKQHSIVQLQNDLLLQKPSDRQGLQQQQDLHFKGVCCKACKLKPLAASGLSALSSFYTITLSAVRNSSNSKSLQQTQQSTGSSATATTHCCSSATLSCKACWQLQLQQIDKHERILSAQLSASCKAQAQKQAMQAAGYSAYAFAVPSPSSSLCAHGYTTWLEFNQQLSEDKAKHNIQYMQYREAYVGLLVQHVMKQGGSLQPAGCLAKLKGRALDCVALASGPVQQWVEPLKQHLCWDSVKQLPWMVLFHLSQLLLLLLQCVYVPLSVVLVPFLWVGREITTTVDYTAKWLWEVWKAAVQSMVYMFAKVFRVCLE